MRHLLRRSRRRYEHFQRHIERAAQPCHDAALALPALRQPLIDGVGTDRVLGKVGASGKQNLQRCQRRLSQGETI